MKKILLIIMLTCSCAMAYSLIAPLSITVVASFFFLGGYCLSICIVVFVGQLQIDRHIERIDKYEKDQIEINK